MFMEEISLKEVILIIFRNKWLILLLTVICVIIGFVVTMLLNENLATAKKVISLNFPGIENGENPDGTDFDITLMSSPVVLNRMLEETGLDYMPETIRRGTEIFPIIPDAISEIAVKKLENGEIFKYYPSDYVVRFNIKHDKASNLFDRIVVNYFPKGEARRKEAQQILEGLTKSYTEYFFETYFEMDIIGDALVTLDYENYDFPYISEIMTSQLNTMQAFITAKMNVAQDFRSQKTGFSFYDIKEALGIIKKIDINRVASIIGASNLTWDKERLITDYEYRIKLLKLEQDKKDSEAQVSKNMMDSFIREGTTIYLPGISDSDSGFLKQDENTYYDKLAERSTNAGVEALNYEHQISFYMSEIEKFRNDTVAPEIKAKAEREVLEMISRINIKLEYWIKIINETIEDFYNVKYGSIIKTVSPVNIVPSVNLKLNLAVSFIIGIMFGVFIAFLKVYWRGSIKENKTGVDVNYKDIDV